MLDDEILKQLVTIKWLLIVGFAGIGVLLVAATDVVVGRLGLLVGSK